MRVLDKGGLGRRVPWVDGVSDDDGSESDECGAERWRRRSSEGDDDGAPGWDYASNVPSMLAPPPPPAAKDASPGSVLTALAEERRRSWAFEAKVLLLPQLRFRISCDLTASSCLMLSTGQVAVLSERLRVCESEATKAAAVHEEELEFERLVANSTTGAPPKVEAASTVGCAAQSHREAVLCCKCHVVLSARSDLIGDRMIHALLFFQMLGARGAAWSSGRGEGARGAAAQLRATPSKGGPRGEPVAMSRKHEQSARRMFPMVSHGAQSNSLPV